MDQTTDTLVVGVRFSKVGKIYDFESNGLTDLKVGDQVVVETSRGWQLGQVAKIMMNVEPPPEGWKAIDRRATPRDLLLRQMWQQQEANVIAQAKSKATDLRLQGIKIVGAEYSFDGARLTILFSSETEEKYDLKSLRQDMQRMFGPSQVEMRQIGPRDVAKLMCGMGACGLEKRCCCSFLTEFSSISIRMAKEQGISLTPTEITGMCGRLRCCLIYEYETYVDARQTLPKRNKRVRTPKGDGKVVDVAPLRGTVIVDVPEQGYNEFPLSDIVVLDENGQPAPMPEAGRPAMDPAAAAGVTHSGPEDGFTGKPSEPRPAMPKDEFGNREERINLDSAPREPRPPRDPRPDREGRGSRDSRGRGGQRGASSNRGRPQGGPPGEGAAASGGKEDQRRGPRRPDNQQNRRPQGGQAAGGGHQGQPGEARSSNPPAQGPRRPGRSGKGQGSRGGRDQQRRKGKQHGSDGPNNTNTGGVSENGA